MPQITVTVSETGETNIAVSGAPGATCKSLTRDLEAALGKTTSDQHTPEFLQQAPQSQTRKAGQA